MTRRKELGSPRPTGRPSKLDQGLLNAIIRDVKQGIFVVTACEASGIDEATYYRWMREDRQGFRQSVKKAERDLQSECLGTIGAGAEGWQGSAWLMERRFPKQWSMRIKAAIADREDELHRRLRDGLSPELYLQVMDVLAGNGEKVGDAGGDADRPAVVSVKQLPAT